MLESKNVDIRHFKYGVAIIKLQVNNMQKEKKVIETNAAPGAIGPYSQAIMIGNLVFTSGQLPVNPATGKIVEGSITNQTHQALKNLIEVVSGAGGTLDDVVKTTVYLQNISDFKEVNSVYAEYFKGPFPARSAFQVAALPLGAGIEIEAIVSIHQS
jgi:2-iminobutanoate/2-iminopropanoate deaminase